MRLSPQNVRSHLRGSYGREEYYYAAVCPSTQRLLPPSAAHGAIAVAEHQTEGRGRLGRAWLDVPGRSILLSVALAPRRPESEWPGLMLVAARAVAAAIRRTTGRRVTIKEPNDLLVDGRKVAGVLAEAGDRVVLGIGINVGESAWEGSATLGAAVDRTELLVAVLEELERAFNEWDDARAPGAAG